MRTYSIENKSDSKRIITDDVKSHGVPSVAQMVAFAAPTGAVFFLINPAWTILPGIYAKYFGLDLTLIAGVILFARLFDAITDPIIGFLSDRHHSRGGSRKIWVMWGGVTAVISAYFLYSPPSSISLSYYLVWSLFFYLSFTIIDMPHAAWGAELVTDYDGRARTYSYRVFFMSLGQVLFFSLPLWPIFDLNEYTPEVLVAAVFIGGILMLSSLLLNYFYAPNGKAVKTDIQDDIDKILTSVIRNKPLLIFLSTYLFVGIGYGMWAGLVFVYLDGYLNLGSHIAKIFLFGNVAAMLCIPLWLWLISKTAKTVAWAAGMALDIVLLVGCFFIKPGMTWVYSLICIGGTYVAVSGMTVAATAMLGDIADYGLFKFSKNRGATYFALLTLSFKITMGFGGALALWLAGYYGFDATLSVQSDDAIFGMKLAFIAIPVVFSLMALVSVVFTPINKTRHRALRKRIEKRL